MASGKRTPRERLPRERIEDNNARTENGSGEKINKLNMVIRPTPAALRNNLGGKAGPGRPVGSKNGIPKRFTEAFLKGCEMHGSDGEGKDGLDGYGYFLASDAKVGGMLISRILPQRVTTSVDPQSALGQLLEAARARLQYERSRTITYNGGMQNAGGNQ